VRIEHEDLDAARQARQGAGEISLLVTRQDDRGDICRIQANAPGDSTPR
jgi:hypothetical protein